MGATTGNVSVTSLSFTPKGALFIWNGQATQNTTGTGANFGMGAAVSTSNRGAWHHRRLLASSSVFGRHTGAGCMVQMSTGNVIDFAVDFVSWNSNGFTVNVGTSPGVDFFVQWYVWGGTDVEVGLLQFNSDVSTGTEVYTGMGFKPDALIIFSLGMTATIPTSDGNSRPGIGFVSHDDDGTIRQAGFGGKQVNGANTARRSQSATQAIYIPDTSAMWLAGGVDSLDADGFTVNYTTVQASTVKLWALGIRGIRAYVGAVDQNVTPTTGNQAVTAVGYTPSMLMMGSFCAATVSGQQNDESISLGGATSAAQATNSMTTVSGGNNNGLANYATKLQTCLLGGTPTIQSQATFVSFDTTGFTFNNTTVDATSRALLYMAMAPQRKRVIQISKNIN